MKQDEPIIASVARTWDEPLRSTKIKEIDLLRNNYINRWVVAKQSTNTAWKQPPFDEFEKVVVTFTKDTSTLKAVCIYHSGTLRDALHVQSFASLNWAIGSSDWPRWTQDHLDTYIWDAKAMTDTTPIYYWEICAIIEYTA